MGHTPEQPLHDGAPRPLDLFRSIGNVIGNVAIGGLSRIGNSILDSYEDHSKALHLQDCNPTVSERSKQGE